MTVQLLFIISMNFVMVFDWSCDS